MRDQINPRALVIIERHYAIAEGYDDDGAPLYRGVPNHAWEAIARDRDFAELVAILHEDYPTFAALVQKIWAKRVGRLLPLIFNRTQRMAWNDIARRIAARLPIFIVFFKARQMGISTLVNGWCHWHIWRLHDIEATLVAHEKPLVYSFVDRLRIFHDELPKIAALQRTLRMGGRNARVPRDEMYYNETRSKVTTVVAKNAEARGRSSPHYHLAEYAFYEGGSDLLGAIMPQLPAAGTPARLACSVIVESTPNGKNDFYDLWQRACDEESEWDARFYPWYVQDDEYSLPLPAGWKPDKTMREWAKRLAHDRRDIDGESSISDEQLWWYTQTLESECHGNQDLMDREYPSDPETAFLLRSRSIFRDDMRYLQATVTESEQHAPSEWRRRGVVMEARYARGFLRYDVPDNPFGRQMPNFKELRLEPEFVFSPRGDLRVWSPPQVDHQYVIGADAAAGTYAGDYSCAQVLDVTEGRQVAELHYKRAPEEFTDDCIALGWWYNCALFYPEINSIGVVCMKRARQVWFYPRVGLQEKWDEVGVRHNKYGMYSTEETKTIMVSFYKHVVASGYLAIASDGLLKEMSIFVETAAGDYQADGAGHDDRVMAMALALAAVRQQPKMLAGFTSKTQPLANPNQMTSMIFDAPTRAQQPPIMRDARESGTVSADARVPDEVRAVLEGYNVLAVPANPISTGLDLPW